MAGPATANTTAADLRAIPEPERFHEILHGELVRKASPSARHGAAQARILEYVGPFNRKPGGRAPGGWWIVAETEIELAPHEVVRPDVCGWRRERLPALPEDMPVRSKPDWVCEVLSPSNATRDRVTKFELYREAGVAHYWLVDPEARTLTVHRWTAEGYLIVLNATRGERVRPEPFVAISLEVGVLFGDDPTQDPSPPSA